MRRLGLNMDLRNFKPLCKKSSRAPELELQALQTWMKMVFLKGWFLDDCKSRGYLDIYLKIVFEIPATS